MNEFKWKVAYIDEDGIKNYSTDRLLDNLDSVFHILGDAINFGEVETITVKYCSGMSMQYEIHRMRVSSNGR